MSLKKNLSYNFLLSLSQLLFPIITIPYVSRIIEPANIGKISFVDSFAYYLIVIAEFGITSYAIREVSRKRMDKKGLDVLVSELLFLHIITSAATLIVYIFSIGFLYHKVHDGRIILFSIIFFLVNCFTFEWYFWGKQKFKYVTIRTLLTRILGVISILLLVKKNEDYFIYYGIITGTAVLNVFWNNFLLFKEVHFQFQNINWKKHIPKVFISYLISIFYSVTLFLDNVLLGTISTTIAVGFYSYAMKVIRISSSIITDTLLVFYPLTVALVSDKKKEEVQQTILYSSQIIILASLPLCAGIFLLADSFTEIYFGQQFQPAANNLKILSFYPLVKAFGLFLNKQLLMPFNKEVYVLKGLILGAITFVPLMFILCQLYADKGASLSVIFSEIAILALNFYYAKKLHKDIKIIEFKTLLQAFWAIILFMPIIYLNKHFFDSKLSFIISSVVSCAIIYILYLSLVVKNAVILYLLQYLKTFYKNV